MDSRTGMTTRRVCAFTLIEMLVVIAVISILIAMLMPMLGSAKDAARNVICMSQLQQMGVSTHQYAEDHDGQAPDFFFNFIHGSDYVQAMNVPKSAQASGMDQYLEEITVCPMDEDPAPVSVVQSDGTMQLQPVSYGVNADIVARDLNIHRFDQPCKITMFFDGLMSNPVDEPNHLQGQHADTLAFTRKMLIRRHNKLANCLYLDNHVAPFTELTSTMVATNGQPFAGTGVVTTGSTEPSDGGGSTDESGGGADDGASDDKSCEPKCDPWGGGKTWRWGGWGKSSSSKRGCK